MMEPIVLNNNRGYYSNETCRQSEADLHSMFPRTSYCTKMVRWCSISSRIPGDSTYSYLRKNVGIRSAPRAMFIGNTRQIAVNNSL